MKINKIIGSIFSAVTMVAAIGFLAVSSAHAADNANGGKKAKKAKVSKIAEQGSPVNDANGIKLPPQLVYASIVVNTKDANEEEIHYLTGGYRPFVEHMKDLGVTVRLLPVRDSLIYRQDIESANSSTKFIFCEMEKCAYAFTKGFTPILKRNDNSRITFLTMSSSSVKKEADLKNAKIAFFGDSVTYFLLEESAKVLFADEFKKNPNLKVNELFNIQDMSHLSKVQLAEYLHDGNVDVVVAPSADMVEITGNHPAAYKKVYVSEAIPSALLVSKTDSVDPSTVEKLKSTLTTLRTEKDRAKWMGVPEDRGFGGEVFGLLTDSEMSVIGKLTKVAGSIDNGSYIKKSTSTSAGKGLEKPKADDANKKSDLVGVSEGSSANVVFKKKEAKPEAAKPVVAKPVVAKPEATKVVVPVVTKPEAAKVVTPTPVKADIKPITPAVKDGAVKPITPSTTVDAVKK